MILILDKLYLLNDVEAEGENAGLIVGSADAAVTPTGKQQAVKIGQKLSEIVQEIGIIAASDAQRLVSLLHHIRAKTKPKNHRVRYSTALRERSFGVYQQTVFSLSSDIFRYSRITAENGESINQCSKRVMQFVSQLDSDNISTGLIVSHPFVCQIICNCLCHWKITLLSQFWLNKGSLMVTEKKNDIWKPKLFVNLLENKEYTVESLVNL